MRTIETHKVNPANEALTITATDTPNVGGLHCRYVINGFRVTGNSSAVAPEDNRDWLPILFQNGPIAEGINGITNEALIAILVDRLQCAQKGPFACRENALALTKLEEAAHWLDARTKDRTARGVEGTHAK